MRLLVSVKNATEANAALAGGADIIDIKDPSRGALGMASAASMQKIVDAVHGRVPVSAALGELNEQPEVRPLPPELVFAKAGLSQKKNDARDWQKNLSSLFSQISHVRPVAVMYADLPVFHGLNATSCDVCSPSFDEILKWAVAHHAAGVLVDTFIKDGRGLFGSKIPVDVIVRRTQETGLLIALAGQLSGQSLQRAIACKPDIIAVRGAVCEGNDRAAHVTENRVRAVTQLIAAQNAQQAASAR